MEFVLTDKKYNSVLNKMKTEFHQYSLGITDIDANENCFITSFVERILVFRTAIFYNNVNVLLNTLEMFKSSQYDRCYQLKSENIYDYLHTLPKSFVEKLVCRTCCKYNKILESYKNREEFKTIIDEDPGLKCLSSLVYFLRCHERVTQEYENCKNIEASPEETVEKVTPIILAFTNYDPFIRKNEIDILSNSLNQQMSKLAFGCILSVIYWKTKGLLSFQETETFMSLFCGEEMQKFYDGCIYVFNTYYFDIYNIKSLYYDGTPNCPQNVIQMVEKESADRKTIENAGLIWFDKLIYDFPFDKFDKRNRTKEDGVSLSLKDEIELLGTKKVAMFFNALAYNGFFEKDEEILRNLVFRLTGYDRPSKLLEKINILDVLSDEKLPKVPFPFKNLMYLIRKITESNRGDSLNLTKLERSTKEIEGDRFMLAARFFSWGDFEPKTIAPSYGNSANEKFKKIFEIYLDIKDNKSGQLGK